MVRSARAHSEVPGGAAPSGPSDFDSPSLTQKAYEFIKERILTLEYRPAECLTEATLSRLLGVGRTPVREALLRLSHEGLVDILPRKGVIIRPDSLNEIQDILESRWVTEPYCTGLAAERASETQIREMEEIHKQLRLAVENRANEALMDMDRRFHKLIIAAAGNETLANFLRGLHERSSRMWRLNLWRDEDRKRTLEEHEVILQALKRGDQRGSVTAMQRHLTSLRRRVGGAD